MIEIDDRETEIVELDDAQIAAVDGGFVCGGLCVLGGISAGVAFMTAGITVGEKLYQATH